MWFRVVDKDGVPLHYESLDGTRQPLSANLPFSPMWLQTALPSLRYFFHKETKEARWTPPASRSGLSGEESQGSDCEGSSANPKDRETSPPSKLVWPDWNFRVLHAGPTAVMSLEGTGSALDDIPRLSRACDHEQPTKRIKMDPEAKESVEPALKEESKKPDTAWLLVGMPLSVVQPFSSRSRQMKLGTVCDLVSIGETTCQIELPPELGGEIEEVTLESCIPCESNSIVRLRGLPRPDLNEKLALVESSCRKDKKYILQMVEDGSRKRFPFSKMVRVPKVRGLNLDLLPQKLVWDQEQGCEFLDSSGHRHRFRLSLPPTFRKTNCEEHRERWPVLFYLPGNGGTSFFRGTKEAIRSPGLQFAFEHFVVISPESDWDWKEAPGEWVQELVRHFFTATWLDRSRLYLAGYSLGGMGAWMLCTELCDIFAAVAVCAGYHDEAQEDLIVERVASMAILVAHSTTDSTCRKAKEHPMWLKLSETNSRLVVFENEDDHFELFKSTFCHSTVLYKWLLAHRERRMPPGSASK